MRLEMPAVDASLRSGKVVRWHVKEGETIGFGDPICDLAVEEFAVLRRTARATLLTGKKRKKLKSDLETREGKVYLEVGITSSDTGVLRKILAPIGAGVAIGETIAVIGSEDHGELQGSIDTWREAPAMRVVINVVNGDNDLEEES